MIGTKAGNHSSAWTHMQDQGPYSEMIYVLDSTADMGNVEGY